MNEIDLIPIVLITFLFVPQWVLNRMRLKCCIQIVFDSTIEANRLQQEAKINSKQTQKCRVWVFWRCLWRNRENQNVSGEIMRRIAAFISFTCLGQHSERFFLLPENVVSSPLVLTQASCTSQKSWVFPSWNWKIGCFAFKTL